MSGKSRSRIAAMAIHDVRSADVDLTGFFGKLHKLLHDLHDHDAKNSQRLKILMYLCAIVVYIGVNLGLLSANFVSQDTIDEYYYASFHVTAFWAVFLFTAFEGVVLISTDVYNTSSILQMSFLLFNTVLTFVVAILFSLSPHLYEVPAHYVEYSAQILISFVNVFFVIRYRSQAVADSTVWRWSKKFLTVQGFLAVASIFLAILQLFIFSEVIPVSIEPERAAHFCEFINEIVNGGFAFWYACMLYRFVDKNIRDHETEMHRLA